jgi:hypothetical protein
MEIAKKEADVMIVRKGKGRRNDCLSNDGRRRREKGEGDDAVEE